MKKVILALVVALLASPAMAVVTITATDLDGAGPEGLVSIDYTVSGETELVRAFALDIQVDAGIIDGVSGFKTGVSVAGDAGFGIFPANFSRYITVNPDGTVADWAAAGYSPVAEAGDPGALGGIGTDGITIEMGSLYDGDANKPANSGTLCIVDVNESCNLTITLNAVRGNVVLENAAEPTVDLQGCQVQKGPEVCFPQTYASYNDWVQMGKPDCWCAPPKGSGYQCDGDADGVTSGIPFNFRVFTGDLSKVIDNWRKKIDDPTLDPCADIDHKDSGIPFRFRVFTADLAVITTNWRVKDAGLPGDCPRN